MKVTIQDVLEAGGGIFGLPVRSLDRPPVIKVEGYCRWLLPSLKKPIVAVDSNPAIGNTHLFVPKNLEVYPDGIRILEIGGRLYRVTGHIKTDYSARKDCYSAKLEPLIPDKSQPEVCDESIKTAYSERRFGRFLIRYDLIRDTPHRVLEFFLRSKMLVLKTNHLPEHDGSEYTVVHPSFPPVPQGQVAPRYALAYSAESVGDGRTEEKIIGWDITNGRIRL